MNEKATLVILGGVGAVVAIAMVASHGQTTSQGVVFRAPSDASVSAVENAASSEINSVNALSMQRSQIASTTLLGLAQLQEQLNLGSLAAGSTDLQTTNATAQIGLQQRNATAQVALQQANSMHQTDVGGQVANYAAMLANKSTDYSASLEHQSADLGATLTHQSADLGATLASQSADLGARLASKSADYSRSVDAGISRNSLDSQNYQANLGATAANHASDNALSAAIASIQAQLQATQITSDADQQLAKTAANVAHIESDNATTQARIGAGAQKTSAFWGALGNIAGAVTSVFSGGAAAAPAVRKNTNTVSSGFQSFPAANTGGAGLGLGPVAAAGG